MNTALRTLPIGVQDFGKMREHDFLYVDKTAQLQHLVESGMRYFLSRPEGFGKTLMLSTLEAMFQGRVELFKGLSAEEWVRKQYEKPVPVVRLNMGSLCGGNPNTFINNLCQFFDDLAAEFDFELDFAPFASSRLHRILDLLHSKNGHGSIVLVDECQRPFLEYADNADCLSEMRSFYATMKGCCEYMSFCLLTDVSEYCETDMHYEINSLLDISDMSNHNDIIGFTQSELQNYFSEWIADCAKKSGKTVDEFDKYLKESCDRFCFDEKTEVFNPSSLMQILHKCI